MGHAEVEWNKQHLRFLTDAAAGMARLRDFDSICSLITSRMREFTGVPITGVAMCKDGNLLGTIKSVSACEQIVRQVETTMGVSITGAPIAIPWELRKADALSVVSWGEHIDSAGAPQGIGLKFGLDKVYGFPFCQDGKLFAVAGLVLQHGQELTTPVVRTLELFLRYATVALLASLREANQANHPILETTAAQHPYKAAVILLENGRVVDCNEYVAAMTGYEPETLLGKQVHHWLAEKDCKRLEEKTLKLVADAMDGAVQEFMFEHQRPDGSLRVMETRMLPLRLPAGKIVLQLIIRDVTERVRIEEALRESESKYRDLFETSRDGIVMTDEKGCYIDCNPAFLSMVGYRSVEELRGRSYLELTPDEYHQLDLEQEALLETSRYREYEKEYFRSNGDRILVWVRLWKRCNSGGRKIGGWALIRDITSVRRMEEELSNIEKFRLLGELAAAISHEIRNPLTTVRGFLQFLPTKSKYPPEDKELFDLMLCELDIATTIIRDFLDMAKPATPRTETLSLTELLASLARVMESKAIIENVQLTTCLEPELRVAGDLTQLRQVFLNLMQNAFQAMPDGGTLSVATHMQGSWAVISIADTGVGISRSNLDRIGRPFFSTKPGGTGLGLATCFRIVGAHGGKITVQSEEGKGATFTVTLPLETNSCSGQPDSK